jgi:hypothetical protein
MTIAKQFGEGIYVLPAIGLTIAGGLITDSPKTTDTGLLSLKSFILAQCVTQSFKLTHNANAPPPMQARNSSTPGIAKMTAFPRTLLHSLEYRSDPGSAIQESKWVAPTVYSIATLTSISRVHDNNHWASDAFTGARNRIFYRQTGAGQHTPSAPDPPFPYNAWQLSILSAMTWIICYGFFNDISSRATPYCLRAEPMPMD